MSSNERAKVALLQSEKAKAEQITDAEVDKMVKDAISLSGGFTFIKDGETVVIKPNLIGTRVVPGPVGFLTMFMTDPYKRNQVPVQANGMTTDWRVTRAVVEMVRDVNPSGKVYIMECSGEGVMTETYKRLGYTLENLPGVDRIMGLDQEGRKYRDVNDKDLVSVDLGDRQRYKKLPSFLNNRYYFDKTYFSADKVISIACLKNHAMAAVTGGIKNVGIGVMPGKVYGNNKNQINRAFTIDHSWEPLSNFIHDYYMCKPVDYVVTDGLQGLAYGPQAQGAPSYNAARMNMRLVLAGKDPVAVDTVHASIIGVDPMKVDYLQHVAKSTGGENIIENIDVVGNRNIDQVKKVFPMAKGLVGKMYPEPGKTLDPEIIERKPSMSGEMSHSSL